MPAPVATSLESLTVSNIRRVDFNGSRSDAEGKSRHHEDQQLHVDYLTVLQVTGKQRKDWIKGFDMLERIYIRKGENCLSIMRQEDLSQGQDVIVLFID